MYVCMCNIVSKIRRYLAINHSSSHFEKKKKKVKKTRCFRQQSQESNLRHAYSMRPDREQVYMVEYIRRAFLRRNVHKQYVQFTHTHTFRINGCAPKNRRIRCWCGALEVSNYSGAKRKSSSSYLAKRGCRILKLRGFTQLWNSVLHQRRSDCSGR